MRMKSGSFLMIHCRFRRLPGKMQGKSCAGMRKPAGTLTAGGGGFCDNTFCEPMDAASANAKQIMIEATNTRILMPHSSSPLSWRIDKVVEGTTPRTSYPGGC